MPQITDIKPQKRQKKVNVFLDGKFSFSLDLETLAKTGLRLGQRLSQESIEEIVKKGEFTKIESRVLKFLSYRPRSERELFSWFRRKNVGEKTQKAVAGKLKRLGYINDKEFAKWWLEQRTAFRPQGLKLTKLELRRRGVDRALIEEILGKEFKLPEQRWAEKAALKKLKSLKRLSKQKTREKLAQFLLRRGFLWETIKEVIKKLT